jgi:hypothetical protein
MCAALPRSDYYGDSAPRSRRHWTWQFAALRGRGARIGVLVFQRQTLDALGGRLYPWQRGPLSHSGEGERRVRCGRTQHDGNKSPGLWLHSRRL